LRKASEHCRLRWINAAAAKSVQTATMMLFKPRPSAAAPAQERPDTVRNLPALAERHDLVTVPAAWPTGVSQLAQAIDACQRCEPGQVGMDWLARAPG